MKLNEIYDPEVVPVLDVGDDEAEIMGSGYYARVHASKRDPHMVIKTTDKDTDPYDSYVSELLDSEKWKSNPHFPRIYAQGTQNKKYVMEKLVSWQELDRTELIDYFMNNFNEDDFGSDREFTSHIAKSRLVDVMAIIMDSDNFKERINNETLLEAVLWVRRLAKFLHVNFDLHKNNFMWRRGPHGIQLVITDPFSKSYGPSYNET